MSIGEQNFRVSSESTIRTRLGALNLVFSLKNNLTFLQLKRNLNLLGRKNIDWNLTPKIVFLLNHTKSLLRRSYSLGIWQKNSAFQSLILH